MSVTTYPVKAMPRQNGGYAFQKNANAAIAELSRCYLSHESLSIDDISELVLNQAKKLTQSRYGFVAYIDPETGWLIAPTLTRDAWKKCKVEDKSIVFKKFTGLWGWALNNKKIILTNNAQDDPRSSGTPDFYAMAVHRKFAEEKVREGEEKLRAIINASKDIIYTINDKGIITFISDHARNYGYDPEEILGKPAAMFTHPEDVQRTIKAVKKAFRTGKTSKMFRFRIRKKNGDYFIAEQKSGIINRGGKPRLVSGVIRDMTEQRNLDARLRANEEMLRKFFDTAKDAIFIKDTNGVFIKVNKACAELFAMTPKQMQGKTDWDIFPRKTAEKLIERNKTVMEKGETLFLDHQLETASGLKIMNAVKTPLRDSRGRITGMLGIARDVTEFKKLEAELIHARAVKAVNKLANGVAHDFNNILSAIDGYATLMLETAGKKGRMRLAIEEIKKAVLRASKITQRLQKSGIKHSINAAQSPDS
ncbi:MAG: PAS domain S-box protein [Elusimicrobia bacterium]|nr:PAS domain S-box protein [Elusimicrobiota bacterium]